MHRLPHRIEQRVERRTEQLRRARTGGDDRLRGPVLAIAGRHDDVVAFLPDRDDGAAGNHRGLRPRRKLQLRRDADLGPHVATTRLEVADLIVAHRELREAPARLGSIKPLQRNAMVTGRLRRRLHERGPAERFLGIAVLADIETPDLEQHLVAGRRFELAPDRVAAAREGDIEAPLPDRLARHAAAAVVRTTGMRRCETVDADRRHAKPRELVKGGAAHGAEADNRNIVDHPPSLARNAGFAMEVCAGCACVSSGTRDYCALWGLLNSRS